MIYEYRQATMDDLEILWNKNIAVNPGDNRWVQWKAEYIGYNRDGKAITFAVICSGEPVGEGTLILSPDCKAVSGRPCLADGRQIANINALRIEKNHEGRGHISKIVRMMEAYAKNHGCTDLTIGVEAAETRNLAIYLHWGYTRFLMSENDGGALVLYYGKAINQK